MIGLVGNDTDTLTAIAETVETAGATPRIDDPDAIAAADPTAVIARGDQAVIDLVQADCPAPVIPTDVGPGLPDTPASSLADAINAVIRSNHATQSYPVLTATVDDTPAGRAVFDAMLITQEPARISEYSLTTPTATHTIRADGIVTATPAGSHGYAHALGGPLLDHDVAAITVVPVAPFSLDPPQWIVDTTDPLTLTINRNDHVTLLLDGHPTTTADNTTPITLTTDPAGLTIIPPP